MNEASWGPRVRPALFAATALAVGLVALILAI